MAAATLTLGVPKLVTTSSTSGKLRKIVLPIGTRTLKVTADAPWFLDAAGSADEGDETTASQFKYGAGTLFETLWVLGNDPILRSTQDLYIIGSSTSQSIWLHAVPI